MIRSAIAFSITIPLLAAASACGGSNYSSIYTPPTPPPTSSAQALASTPTAPQDVVDTLAAMGGFTTLKAAITQAGLEATLRGPGPFTIFAPTDDAFKKLPPDQLAAVMKDNDKLKTLLTYHVAPATLTQDALAPLHSLKTVSGDYLAVQATGTGTESINGANITATRTASNGIIYGVDAVLMPPVERPPAP